MSDREEFNWKRMRQEEDDYFAVKNAEPKSLGPTVRHVMQEARKIEHRPEIENDELARLQRLSYREYLKTPHWIATSARIKKRDGYRCRDCSSRKKLNVHHKTYLSLRGQERDNDLLTLCRRCHIARHRERIPGRWR